MSYKIFISPSSLQAITDMVSHIDGHESGAEVPGNGGADGESIFWDWCVTDALGERVASGQKDSFDGVMHLLAQNNISEFELIGLLPASACYLGSVNIPSKQARVVHQALPFAVEELVAQDVQTLHLSVGEREKNNIPVLVVDTHLFNYLFQSWKNSGLNLKDAYCEAQLLPLQQHDAVVYIAGGTAWFNSKSRAVKIPRSLLVTFIEQWVAEANKDKLPSVHFFINNEKTEDRSLYIANLQQLATITSSFEETSLEPIEIFAEGYFHNNDSISLCQGDFSIEKQTSANWKQWTGVAAVLCLWLLAEVGFNIGKGLYYQHKADIAVGEALADYKSVFTTDRRVNESNLKRFLKSKLMAAGSDKGDMEFLNVLGITGAELYKVRNNQNMQMNSINFNAQRGEMNFEINAASLDQLDQLKNGIKSGGFEAKIGSAVKEKEHIRGRISIQRENS